MSKEDLDKATFRFERPKKAGLKIGRPEYVSTPLPIDQQGEAVCFDIKGKWTNDQENCAAKTVIKGNNKLFFVKWCLDGPDKGHLLNPYSIYYREGDDARLAVRRGQKRYEFKRVSESAFSSYLQFLKTRLYKHCQEAERGILNA